MNARADRRAGPVHPADPPHLARDRDQVGLRRIPVRDLSRAPRGRRRAALPRRPAGASLDRQDEGERRAGGDRPRPRDRPPARRGPRVVAPHAGRAALLDVRALGRGVGGCGVRVPDVHEAESPSDPVSRYYEIEIFTDTPGHGNPAGVLVSETPVPDAEQRAWSERVRKPGNGFLWPAGAKWHARFHTP